MYYASRRGNVARFGDVARLRSVARRQAVPEQVEGRVDAVWKRTISVDRPQQQRAENSLAKDVGDFRGRQIAANFAAILSGLHQTRKQSVAALVIFTHDFAHRRSGKGGLQQSANDRRIARRLRGHVKPEGAQERGHGLPTLRHAIHRGLQLGDLHVAKRYEEVVLAREVIEKGAFADVGGLGNVFDGGFREAFQREEIQRSAEERFASSGTAASATTRFEIVVGGAAGM